MWVNHVEFGVDHLGQLGSIRLNHVYLGIYRQETWIYLLLNIQVYTFIGYIMPIIYHLRSAEVILYLYSFCYIPIGDTINCCNITKTKNIPHLGLMKYLRIIKDAVTTSSKQHCICLFLFYVHLLGDYQFHFQDYMITSTP